MGTQDSVRNLLEEECRAMVRCLNGQDEFKFVFEKAREGEKRNSSGGGLAVPVFEVVVKSIMGFMKKTPTGNQESQDVMRRSLSLFYICLLYTSPSPRDQA
eukprot:TRINITY_DN29590_c0_g1_i1.p2 TRINITY_DN29590_c0_g1~~TRINITY_DN29590_c0_g1_i1.p2  ORF type:complete len:101 (-),score=38.87 TRINITY_DN29590_c0_g1_i1:17-319(-)